ncbi:voltage-dependent calcium channel gamma-7 subunit [Elysia marginata]|uniref:Voltage-dependent calcium channel gamma-7 subunit n=1 Tax=Elysia marginata TaxID=1093978 RepID=A0AAV4H3P2_9GAST|nr:voltage-dependent calcium channel gamma-7 subunit [Elysia marginata]
MKIYILQKHEGGFTYNYGWSFYTAGFGFLASELSAVVTITLFLRRNERLEDMTRIIPGLEDKVPLGKAQENQVVCDCEELEASGKDAWCSLCCRAEFDNNVRQPRPWHGFCGIKGGACSIVGGTCGEGGDGSVRGGGGCGIVRSSVGVERSAHSIRIGVYGGSGGSASRDGSDRSVGGEDGSSSSRSVGKLKRSLSVSA